MKEKRQLTEAEREYRRANIQSWIWCIAGVTSAVLSIAALVFQIIY